MRIVLIAITVLYSTAIAYASDGSVPNVSGPLHSPSIKCVDTTILEVTPRLENSTMQESGVEVWFASNLGVEKFGTKQTGAGVVHYQGDDNAVMAAEHPGDKVQVCLVGVPNSTDDPGCDPKTDPRGRVYRVYDYKQKASYSGINGEHGCGGA